MEQTIAQASPHIWLLIFAAGLLSAFGLYGFGQSLRRGRLIENTPSSRIRSAAQGFVELHGLAYCLPDAEITAELSRRKCVWYAFRVDHKVRNANDRSTSWETIERGESRTLFELRDGDAHCLIDPTGADIIGATEDTWYGDTPRPHGGPVKTPWWSRSGDYRYVERRLPTVRYLYVWGEYTTYSTVPGQSEAVSALLKQWKLDEVSLLQRFDANRDGAVDIDEWETARTVARREARAARERDGAEASRNVVRQPSTSTLPFILSTTSETTMRREYRLQGGLCGALFLGAGAACVWMAVIRLAAL